MKLNPNIHIRKVGDEYLLTLNNEAALNYTHVTVLNESAAYLLQTTGNAEFTAASWQKLLTDRYQIDDKTAERDVLSLIEKLVNENLISES